MSQATSPSPLVNPDELRPEQETPADETEQSQIEQNQAEVSCYGNNGQSANAKNSVGDPLVDKEPSVKAATNCLEEFRLLEHRMKHLERHLLDIGIDVPFRETGGPKSNPELGTKPGDEVYKEKSFAIDKESEKPTGSIKRLQWKIHLIEESLRDHKLFSGSSTEAPSESESEPGLGLSPAIPKLNYVDWTEFQDKVADAKQKYAIDVLVGGARSPNQRKDGKTRSRTRLEDKRDLEANLVSVHGEPQKLNHGPTEDMPERIRINSRAIVLNLSNIDTSGAYSTEPLIMLRPYKILCYYEKAIRSRCEALEAKWGILDVGMGDKAAPYNIATGGVNLPPTVAKTHSLQEQPNQSDTDNGKNQSIKVPSSTIQQLGQATNSLVETELSNNKLMKEPLKGSALVDSTNTAELEEMLPSQTHSNREAHRDIADNQISRNEGVRGVATETLLKAPDLKKLNKDDKSRHDLADSSEALEDIKCLISFLDMYVNPVVDALRGKSQRKIAHSNLWFLFKPGDLVIAPLNKSEETLIDSGGRTYPRRPNDRFQEAWRVYGTETVQSTYKGPGESEDTGSEILGTDFAISTYYIDFTGSRFVRQIFHFFIDNFQGEKDITSLLIYPIRYAPDAELKMSAWESRGRSFLEYKTVQQRYYKGKTLICRPDGFHLEGDDFPRHAENVDSQVVVDFNEALDAQTGWSPFQDHPTKPSLTLTRAQMERKALARRKHRDNRVRTYTHTEWLYTDSYINANMVDDYLAEDEMLKLNPDVSLAIEGKFGSGHLVLLPNRVFAFVLRNRRFTMLTVEGLRPIQRYMNAFDDLQLTQHHKQTVKALVHAHFTNKNAEAQDTDASQDADLVRGKGNGLVVLLHGAPGVGKTSTAECVAEAFGRLLFPITCGDLGLVAEDVENELSEKFHLAELWDCVLLLDEADVFLARRTSADIKRNSLVSVFLRMLEYFSGILFLTTNRVGAFDEAFKSRIHVSLYYPPLDWPQTDKIWRMNIRRLSEKKKRRGEVLHVDQDKILAYAYTHYNNTLEKEMNWNGRQIKNGMQAATALAEYDAYQKFENAVARYRKRMSEGGGVDIGPPPIPVDPVLRVSHFKKVALASYEFDSYITETKGSTDAEIAHQLTERTDHFRVKQGKTGQRENSVTHPGLSSQSSSRSYPRDLPQPAQQANRPPAMNGEQLYATRAQVFTGEAPQQPQPLARDPSTTVPQYGFQVPQSMPHAQHTLNQLPPQPPAFQNIPAVSAGGAQYYPELPRVTSDTDRQDTRTQQEQSKFSLPLPTHPFTSRASQGWELTSPDPGTAVQRQEPHHHQAYQQAYNSSQQSFPQQYVSQHQQYEDDPTEDVNSVFE